MIRIDRLPSTGTASEANDHDVGSVVRWSRRRSTVWLVRPVLSRNRGSGSGKETCLENIAAVEVKSSHLIQYRSWFGYRHRGQRITVLAGLYSGHARGVSGSFGHIEN